MYIHKLQSGSLKKDASKIMLDELDSNPYNPSWWGIFFWSKISLCEENTNIFNVLNYKLMLLANCQQAVNVSTVWSVIKLAQEATIPCAST